jgi:DNA-binding IclR family transcriptional regulator
VAGHACTLTDPNGTGDEPGGIIPVCCAPSSSEQDDALELFTRLNAHRTANGKPPLTYDEDLEATIQAHLLHQSLHPFASWTAPESVVETLGDRAALCGTSTSGGVFVMNVSSASAAMTQWKSNSAYNDMLLSTSHTRVGGGRYQTQWALQFGP